MISDLHLFSTEIGGNWSEDSFIIFKERILPKVMEENPDAIIFLGDILDPHSGRSVPRWPKGDEASGKFVKAIREAGIEKSFILRGNHDYIEPLKNIEMGGPIFIDDDWLKLEDVALYFFSSRYPNLQKTIDDLKSIPDIDAKVKILLMHENLSFKDAENIPKDVMEEVCRRFDMVFNGHQHFYDHPYNNVWCLSSALPWHPWPGNSDIEIIWESKQSEPDIKEYQNKFGFYLIDVKKKHLKFEPVEIGLKIITAKLQFSNAAATEVRNRLIKLSELLNEKFETKKCILRVYLEGTLKEGDERIDVGFSDIETKYYSNFYEGRSRTILRVEGLKGGGAYLSKEDLRYVSVEDALKQLESEIPKIREFYEEVSDLIEKKTFDGEALIERVLNSKVLEDAK